MYQSPPEQIIVFVENFHGHTWYYPFMPPGMLEKIEAAAQRNDFAVLIDREDLERMMGEFIQRISN